MVSVILLALAAAPAEFEFVEEVDGIRVESRPLAGSHFVQLRLTATSALSVARLCDAAFGDGKIPSDEKTVRVRKVLSESTDERVTYDQVAAPIVSDRDYVLRWTRSHAGDRCSVRYDVASDAGVPPAPKFVRLTVIAAEWTFSPAADGGTRIEYVSHSEPGGGLPPFLIEGTRRRTEADSVRRTIARAKREPVPAAPVAPATSAP